MVRKKAGVNAMSGSLSSLSVDTSIPLQAGKIPERPNPFTPVNQFAETWRGVNAAKGSEVNLATKTNQAVNAGLAPLLAEKSMITLSGLTSRAAVLEKQFGLPSGAALKMVSGISAPPDTPEWDRQVRNMIASGMQTDPGAALAQVAGQPYAQDIGSGLVSGVQHPAHMGGARVPTSMQRRFITPSEATELVTTGYDPEGNPMTGPKISRIPSEFAGPGGSPQTTGMPVPVGRPGPFGNTVLTPGAGRNVFQTDGGYRPPEERKAGGLPPALRGPNQSPGAGIPGSEQRTLPPGSLVSPSPGIVKAAEDEAGFAAKEYDRISREGTDARQQQTVLSSMHNDLQRFNPGSGVVGVNEFKKAIGTWADSMGVPHPINMEKLSAYESFQKFANQLANAQGAGSNERLNVTIHANPNVAMSREGLDLVTRQLLGNTDYLRAKQQVAAEWQKDPKQKSQIRSFLADFERDVDPRVFQFMRMTDPQRSDYLNGITSPKDKRDFQEAWRFARDNRLIGQ